jgi:nitrous oxidase accessory protein NosD
MAVASVLVFGSLVGVGLAEPGAFAAPLPAPPAGAVIVNNFSYSPQSSLPAACAIPAFPSIEAAVSAAVPTETIYVCAGTYDEDVTIMTSDLTLLGAEYGVDPTTPSGPESVIDDANGPVQIEADSDTINGFTIQGAVNDPLTVPGAFGAGIWTNPGFSSTQGGVQILDNIIQDNIAGIELDNTGVIPASVEDNLIQNNNEPGSGSGNGIEVDFGLSNATVESNTFSGDTSASMVVEAPSDLLTVSDNTLVGGASEGFAFFDVSLSSIDDNISIGSTSGATVYLGGGDSLITIDGNVLADGMRGIQVQNEFGGPNSAVTANQNCIEGNSAAGLEEDTGGYSPGPLDATDNWWGSASGPTIASNPGGTGDRIIDQDGVVVYVPFLTANPGGACPLAAAAPSGPEVSAVVQVQTSPSYAGDPVLISSSQLKASCGGGVTFETLQLGSTLSPRTSPNSITVVLDGDGNATVVVTGVDCAPGSDLVEADLTVAPYLTETTTVTVVPPEVTAAGVTGYPADEIETGDTAKSGDSDVYTVFSVETSPVYAEQTVEISSAQLEARCGGGWRWEPGAGAVVDQASATTVASGILDDDGNATFVFKGVSCAAGTSEVIADVEAGSHPTYTSTYTIEAPLATVATMRLTAATAKARHPRHKKPKAGAPPPPDPPAMTVTASPNPLMVTGS